MAMLPDFDSCSKNDNIRNATGTEHNKDNNIRNATGAEDSNQIKIVSHHQGEI